MTAFDKRSGDVEQGLLGEKGTDLGESGRLARKAGNIVRSPGEKSEVLAMGADSPTPQGPQGQSHTHEDGLSSPMLPVSEMKSVSHASP